MDYAVLHDQILNRLNIHHKQNVLTINDRYPLRILIALVSPIHTQYYYQCGILDRILNIQRIKASAIAGL
jgi:hypothetical protein